MKSVIGTIIIFIGLYFAITNAVVSDIMGFFAQKSFTFFAIGAIITMFIVAVIVLGLPKKKKGEDHDKDKHLN